MLPEPNQLVAKKKYLKDSIPTFPGGYESYVIHPKWMFPKLVGFPPRSSILIGFSMIFTIHFGVPLLLETPKYTSRPTKAFKKKHPNLIPSPEPNLGRIPIAQGRKTPPQGTWKKRKLRTMRMARKDFRARILGWFLGVWIHGCFVATPKEVYMHLEPQRTVYFKWLFQLDDEPNLYIGNGCFSKRPFINGCLGFQASNITYAVGTYNIHV